jgi:hypothetical protein
MKSKPDINRFIDSGAADVAEQSRPIIPKTRIHREQKVFRLPLDLIDALKREAFEQSMQSGVRVTETELVEQALRAYLKV